MIEVIFVAPTQNIDAVAEFVHAHVFEADQEGLLACVSETEGETVALLLQQADLHAFSSEEGVG